MRELVAAGGDRVWRERADELSAAIDEQLWDRDEGLWSDRALVGPSDSVAVPTLDGALPALSTSNPELAARALDQLNDESRFLAPYGLAYVAREHPLYRPDLYWRGAAWPQLNHLARVTALRWGRTDLADEIAAMTRRGAVTSNFSELWDPETGEARGAVPQTWAALAAVNVIDQPPAEISE
jgi:glycogen debranching enzyme